ncbi:MAG: hypothetical protein L6Q35_13815, partial [Phycisphaerales bacterium]|nr:hypothetical protein [Phycisphaerales bacterium]
MNAVAFEPWLVCGSGHPGRDVGFLEQMRFLVGYAILAPSPHNAQPWYFRALKERIGVHIDRTRVLKFCDPHDREATIGCGCAIFNLCLAIRHFGNAAVGELLPDAAQPDLLAAIGIGDRRNADHECNSLFEAIPKRRTNRLKFETRAPDAAFLEKLEQIARADGAWLHVVRGRQMRHALAELIAEGDRFQWHDVRFRRELAGWVHSNRSD